MIETKLLSEIYLDSELNLRSHRVNSRNDARSSVSTSPFVVTRSRKIVSIATLAAFVSLRDLVAGSAAEERVVVVEEGDLVGISGDGWVVHVQSVRCSCWRFHKTS